MAVEGAKPTKLHIWDSTNKEWKKWDGVLTTGDIEIGAVEIKDHDGSDRLEITSSNAAKVDGSAVTQPVSGTFWQTTQPISGTVAVSGTITANTELPAAAALADSTANPTVPGVGAYLMKFDGTDWDRLQLKTTGTLDSLYVTLSNGTSAAVIGSGADGKSNSSQSLFTAGMNYVYNGSTWDRLRGDTSGLDISDISAGTQTNDVKVTLDSESVAVTGTFWQTTQPVSLASVPSHAVTNAGTFAVQIVDTSFAVADGNALGEGVLVQGDDGTDRKNIHVDASTGDVQVDVTNTVTVDLGANNDVSLNAGTNVVGKVRLVDSGGTEITETTDHSMQVTIVADDVGIGGGTQYDEDEDHASGDTGTMALVVRDDALAANAGTSADLDYMPMRGDNYGALWVTLTDASGSGVDASSIGGGTQQVYDAAADWVAAGADTITPGAQVRDDALSALTPVEGDYVPYFSNSVGAQWVEVYQLASGSVKSGAIASGAIASGAIAAGAIASGAAVSGAFVDGAIVTLGAKADARSTATDATEITIMQVLKEISYMEQTPASRAVTNAGTFAVQEDGSALTALELIDDIVFTDDTSTHSTGTTKGAGIMAAATPTDGSVAANDIGMLAMSVDRRLHVDAQIVGTDAALDCSGATVTVDLGANNDVTIDNSSIVHLEDVQHSTGDAGVMALAVENEDQADLSTGDKDYTPIGVTKEGNVIVKQEGAIDASGATVTVDNGGTFATQIDGNALTALQLIDNPVAVLGTATYTEATSSGFIIGAVRNDALAALADTDNEIAPLQVNTEGALYVAGGVAHDAADSGESIKIGGRAQEPTAALEEVTADNDRVDAAFDRQGRLAVWMGYPVKNAPINTGTSGDNTIIAAAGAGLRIAVLGFSIVSDGTVDCRWEDGAGTNAKTGQYPFQAREGISRNSGLHPLWVGTANTLLNLELSAAIQVHGEVSYVEMTD